MEEVRRFWLQEDKTQDWLLVLAVGLIFFFGLVTIASSSIPLAQKYGQANFSFLYKQLVFMLVSLCVAWLFWRTPIPMEKWQKWSGLFLILTLLLMLYVSVLGAERKGAVRWLDIFGVISFQPSELLKLTITMFLASYIYRKMPKMHTSISGIAMLAFFPYLFVVALLFLQSDLGSIVVILALTYGVILIAGVPFRFICFSLIPGVVIFLIALAFSPNRILRIKDFLTRNSDGLALQTAKAEQAMLNGGIWGVGPGKSEMKQTLPEAHTDFIIAIFAEEYGFIGVCLLMLLFFILFYRIMLIAMRAMENNNMFECLFCSGVGVWFILQIILSAGVNFQLLPTTGITVPFFSYGGSSLMISVIAIAMVLKIDHTQRVQG